MGPSCPHCGAVYEWTCGELEEHITAPKVYFCQECRGLFVLSCEEIEELQARFRPALDEANSEPDLGEIDGLDGEPETFSLPYSGGGGGGLESPRDSQVLRDSQDGPARARQSAPQWSARDSASDVVPIDPAPLAPREQVVVVAGPHEGVAGEVAVIAGDLVVIRIGAGVVRVLAVHVRRA